jgi:hypothetical protein
MFTVVYFDWKTVIYIYACGKCRTQFIYLPSPNMEFTGNLNLLSPYMDLMTS